MFLLHSQGEFLKALSVFETKKNIALSSIQGDLVVETLMRGLLYLFFKRTFFRHFCASDLIYSGRKVVTCGLIRTNELLLRMSSSKLKMMMGKHTFGKTAISTLFPVVYLQAIDFSRSDKHHVHRIFLDYSRKIAKRSLLVKRYTVFPLNFTVVRPHVQDLCL